MGISSSAVSTVHFTHGAVGAEKIAQAWGIPLIASTTSSEYGAADTDKQQAWAILTAGSIMHSASNDAVQKTVCRHGVFLR
jgi:hypothetical protein